MMRSGWRRGTAAVEFVLATPAAIFVLISIIELSRGMWNYTSLERGVSAGARLAAVRGSGCGGSNSCGVTVGAIASTVAAKAVGLAASGMNLTLTTDSGQTTTCHPLSSCLSNATAWPPSANSDNSPGKTVKVSAQYDFHSALALFWPGTGSMKFAALTFPASSAQQILF
jgi:Flp pilus assembly protein TadG